MSTRVPGGVRALDEAAFLRERIGVQPFEEVGGIGADHLHLREMRMRIDEAGQDEMRPVVDLLRIGGRHGAHGRIGAGIHDHPVLDQQAAVLLVAIARRVVDGFRAAQEGEQASADKGLGHDGRLPAR